MLILVRLCIIDMIWSYESLYLVICSWILIMVVMLSYSICISSPQDNNNTCRLKIQTKHENRQHRNEYVCLSVYVCMCVYSTVCVIQGYSVERWQRRMWETNTNNWETYIHNILYHMRVIAREYGGMRAWNTVLDTLWCDIV